MEFGKGHDTTDTTARANLLRTCYGETGVMDLVHNAVQYDGDISAYTVEKTMDMESRIKAMRELHVAKRRTSLQMSVTKLSDF